MAEEISREADIYEPTRRYLSVSFIQRLREQSTLSDLHIFAADTSLVATPDGGKWTRPDISALVLGRGQFVPHWRADLHTFEVKTASGLSEASVYEANAQGRFGHYTWLTFQSVGKASERTQTFKKVTKLASTIGVGVIHFSDDSRPQDWVVEVWPRRTGTDNHTADAFIRDRFPTEVKAQIADYLAASGWIGFQ